MAVERAADREARPRQPARRRRVGVPAGAVHGGRAGARRGAHARHPDRVRAGARAAHQHRAGGAAPAPEHRDRHAQGSRTGSSASRARSWAWARPRRNDRALARLLAADAARAAGAAQRGAQVPRAAPREADDVDHRRWTRVRIVVCGRRAREPVPRGRQARVHAAGARRGPAARHGRGAVPARDRAAAAARPHPRPQRRRAGVDGGRRFDLLQPAPAARPARRRAPAGARAGAGPRATWRRSSGSGGSSPG